jgi:CheY-like chemotaxis protein
MMLQALLVSKDDQASETLTQVLAQFSVAVVRSSAADVAVARLNDERFDQVIVDFDQPDDASLVLDACRRLTGPERNPSVTAALITDAMQMRSILGMGAHFILAKPVNPDQAFATLRAATALLKRERRQSLRVAVQVPVTIRTNDDNAIEGILLDLSAGGMDVLAAKPISPASLVRVIFDLPDGVLRVEAETEVAWGTPNGQVGLRFLDMDAKTREQMGEWLSARSGESLPEHAMAVGDCKLSDLSLGGCYVETVSPFPQSSAVDLCLKVGEMEIHTDGMVRVMHPGHGMGIEFPARTEEQRKTVEDFIQCLTSQPGVQPQLEASPRSLVASTVDFGQSQNADGSSEDPLLELLRTGSGMEQDHFLAELARQRTPADVSQ